MEISINFCDLKEEVQKEILELIGVKDPAELNWDVWPMFTFEIDPDEYADDNMDHENVIKNGTKVKFQGFDDNRWITGIIDGNDEDDAEDYENLNYYIYPTENKKAFLDYYGSPYIMLLRKHFEIIKEEE